MKKLQDQEKQIKAEDAGVEKHSTALKKVFKDHKISEDEKKDVFNALLEWRKKI